MEDTEQLKPLEINWGFLASDNQSVNQILNEIRSTDLAGNKFDTSEVLSLLQRVVDVTCRYSIIGEVAENAIIHYMTGAGDSRTERHVAPFITADIIRKIILSLKKQNRR